MKKFIVFTLAMYCMVFHVFSSPVDITRARLVAKNMYFERANIHGKVSYQDVVLSNEFIMSNGSTTLYYIFNVSADMGWVAVSADDATVPVLSYAFKGAYNEESQPENFKFWMDGYKQQMARVIEAGVLQGQEAHDLWDYYSNPNFVSTKSTLAVSPLLGSVAWSQGCYYNAQCPVASGGDCGRVPTGCVATAMAMIMKHYAYPTNGFNSKSYVHATYGTLSANFGSATYTWASMPNTASGTNAELAEIMKHCGVAVEMNYGLYGSGAYLTDATTAFTNYFVYAATYEYKAAYTDAIWKGMIKSDLDLSHPILYAGQDPDGGHAFVLDGYQGSSNDYFHFNWGWDGSYNSYNYLTSIVPGNNASNGNYSTDQEAVMGIYPSPATLPVANFTSNYTTIQINNYINFTDMSTNTPLLWSWSVTPSAGSSFVGGTTSASKNPKIAFTATGYYTISLTATNAAGGDTETKSNYITVTGGAGIEDGETAGVQVYPNPCTDYLYIDCSSMQGVPVDIKLINTVGQVVGLQSNLAKGIVSVPVAGLPEGVYFLVFQSEGLHFSQRITIAR